MKVLIVDDSEDQRNVLRLLFSFESVEVMEATGGDEAFDIFRSENFDLVVSDLDMPKGSGLEFLKSVRKISNIPFIIVSGNIAMTPEALEQAGVTAIIRKPYRFEEFYRVLEGIVRKARS